MTKREYLYHTTADQLAKGFVIIRDDNRRVTVEKVYPLGNSIHMRDDSGSIGVTYPRNAPFTVVSDN